MTQTTVAPLPTSRLHELLTRRRRREQLEVADMLSWIAQFRLTEQPDPGVPDATVEARPAGQQAGQRATRGRSWPESLPQFETYVARRVRSAPEFATDEVADPWSAPEFCGYANRH